MQYSCKYFVHPCNFPWIMKSINLNGRDGTERATTSCESMENEWEAFHITVCYWCFMCKVLTYYSCFRGFPVYLVQSKSWMKRRKYRGKTIVEELEIIRKSTRRRVRLKYYKPMEFHTSYCWHIWKITNLEKQALEEAKIGKKKKKNEWMNESFGLNGI